MKKIDVHLHYGYWPFPIFVNENEEDFLKLLAQAEIEKGILSSSLAILYDFVAGNAQVANLISKHNNLYGYIVLNPNYLKEANEELEKYKDNTKFVGVKVHHTYSVQPIDSAFSLELFRLIEKTNLPVLVHTYGYENTAPKRLLKVLDSCPNLTIIMAHMGGDNWREAIEIAKLSQNIYLEPSCRYNEYNKIKEAVDRIGADRIIFGSDAPLLHPYFTIGMIEEARLTEEEKEKIYFKNAEKLFNLSQ